MRLDRDRIDSESFSDRAIYRPVIQYLISYLDSSSDLGDTRLSITQLLEIKDMIPAIPYGTMQLDRAGLDRRYTRYTDCEMCGSESDVYAALTLGLNLIGYLDTNSDIDARLQIDHLMQGYIDTESDIYAALALLLVGYIDTNSDIDARLQIEHLMDSAIDTDSDVYGLLSITHLLQGYIDTDSDIDARLQIDHLMQSYIDTTSDVYAMLRLIYAYTFTYSGSLDVGDVLCIDGDKFTVLKNGSNDIGNFTGDFPIIAAGTNYIVYTDSEGSRDMRLVVTKSDRKV